MSQKDIVLKHMEEFGSITSLEAFMSYNITRLSGIIFMLRKEMKIHSDVRDANFSVYTLLK